MTALPVDHFVGGFFKMVLTLGLQAPCRAPFTVPRKQVSIRCNYVPDYSSPDPENLGGFFGKQPRQRTNRLPIKKFWEYQAPSADIGSPDGYELKPVGIPEYGDGGNNGGRGGSYTSLNSNPTESIDFLRLQS